MFYAICGGAGLITGMLVALLFLAIQSRSAARRKAVRRGSPREPPAKKRVEFSKILAIWATFVATAVVGASIALAAFDKQPVSDLSISVFAACIGYLITYAGKSAFEKSSRNKYHLDEDGKPLDGGSDQEGE